MSEIRDRLRKLRLDNNLTMEELGEKIGVSKMAISRWESGGRRPKPLNIMKYAKYFNVPEEWIIHGEEWTVYINKHQNFNSNLNERLSLLEAKVDKVLELLQSKE